MSPVKKTLAAALQLAFVAGAAAMVYSFVAMARDGETRRKCGAICLMQPAYAGAERVLPSFEVTDLEGRVHRSSEWAGKLVVLNFWTKTCAPCIQEMPAFAHLARVLASRKDVVVAAVSIDEDAAEVASTMKQVLREPPPFETLVDPGGKVVDGKFGTDLFPETWIVDRSGIIRARFDGPRDWSDPVVVELVDEILAGTYCPISIRRGQASRGVDGARLCESLADDG
jgi:thiol-disulfide isomerase/thioredoxin